MQGDFDKNDKPGEEPEARFGEKLAAYFEQRNANETENKDIAPALDGDEELKRALALVRLTDKARQDRPDIEKAWQTFKARAFVPAAAPAVNSLGYYVAEELAGGQLSKTSGLPRETLEALQQDQTPLARLKDFELADYAALAKRYEVKDTLFPRMLKWLKGLGKNFSAPAFGSGLQQGRLIFAREEGHEPQVSETYLAEELERARQKLAEEEPNKEA